MNKPLIYLAGAIKGLTYGECVDWREYARKQFEPEIVAVSPMRAKDYLAQENIIADEYSTPLSSAAGITGRDRYDVHNANAILFNFTGTTIASCGSLIELGWATAPGTCKIIIVVMEDDNPHNHAMVRQLATYILPTLDLGIQIAKAALLYD